MPRTATPYQPHLLDPHSAEPQPVSPANGRSFKLMCTRFRGPKLLLKINAPTMKPL